MPRFVLELDSDHLNHIIPGIRRIVEIARQNNDRVEMTRAPENTPALLCLLCENKPAKIAGLKWVEVKE